MKRSIKYSVLILTYIVVFILHILMSNMILSGEFRDNEYSKRILVCISIATYFALLQRVIINWDLVRVLCELLQYIFYLYGIEFIYITYIIIIHIAISFLSKQKRTKDVMYMLYILHIVQIYVLKLVIEKTMKNLHEETPVESFSKNFVERDIDLIDTHRSINKYSKKLEPEDERKQIAMLHILKNIKNIADVDHNNIDQTDAEAFFDTIINSGQ